MEEQNRRLTRILSAGREALFVLGCLPMLRSLFVSGNLFHARHVQENCFFLDMPCMKKVYKVPGHALHEKGLQRQKGVGPLVSSQEQRALLVPVINRG